MLSNTQPWIITSGKRAVGSETISLPTPLAIWGVMWLRWWLRVACVVVLLLTDIVALLLAASLGYLLWAWSVLHQSLSVYQNLIPLFGLFPLGYAGAGLYPGFGIGAVEMLRRISGCTGFAFVVLAAASYVMKLSPDYSRMTFIIAWGASLISVPLLRFSVLSVVSRWQWWGEPAVVVGSGPWVQWTVRALAKALSLGYRPVGILSPDLHKRISAVDGIPVLGGPEWALYLAEHGVSVALVGEGEQGSITPSWLQQHFRSVLIVRENGDLPIEGVRVRNLGSALGVEFTNNLLQWHNCFIKRTLDIVLGTLLLFCALPLITLGALLVKLSSRGPAFFCQMREGRGGRPITVWKLRTMYEDAECRLKEYLSTNPGLRQEWESHFKLDHDPRVIPGVGQMLRRFSLDELPQLWSVVKGEMSLVGPRPFPDYHLRQFLPEFCELRRRVRPGLTGMWQVTVRSNGSIEEQQLYDTHYIRNWSLWLDLYILTRTTFAVLYGRGAY
jgi:Undecaprenyl-phosphate galactose phosphotransferase WbaP